MLSLLILLCLHGLPGNGFQRYRFLNFHVQQLLSFLAGDNLASQLGITWSQSCNKGYSSLYSLYSLTAASKTPDSHDYTLRITITHGLVFPGVVFTALLGNFLQ
jgi:hypothetical protein